MITPPSNLFRIKAFCLIFLTGAAVLLKGPNAGAIAMLSGPIFTPATKAPLAGMLQVTTDVNSRISVRVYQETNSWERDFYDFSTAHALSLVGFKPNQTNQIFVTAYDEYENACTNSNSLTFITPPLPPSFPHSVLLNADPSKMEPGYLLTVVNNRALPNTNYIVMYDHTGAVVWYAPGVAKTAEIEVKQLGNGDLFLIDGVSNYFKEVNLLGQTVQMWTPPASYPAVNAHDAILTDHGTILYLANDSRKVSNFPTSDTVSNPPLSTVNIADSPVVEFSVTNGTLLNVWSPFDMLDQTRVTYLTYGEYSGSPFGVDNEHVNALVEDTNDNSLIVSMRNQNTVFKFTRAGQLKWILSPPALWNNNFDAYLLTPVGTPFDWSYGQHGPMLTPQGTLLIYDDGIERASPYNPPVTDQANYSRGVEYQIDETNMTISQVWSSDQATNEDRLFTPIVGKTDWLPTTHNVLVTYGYVTYVNGAPPSPNAPGATMARIIEYTHDPVPQVAFDLAFFDYGNTNSSYLGYWCYRSHLVADFYAHPALPVADLVVTAQSGMTDLKFAADPARTYLVQASTNLKNWTTLGSPVQEAGGGVYDYQDPNISQVAARFYRVITQ